MNRRTLTVLANILTVLASFFSGLEAGRSPGIGYPELLGAILILSVGASVIRASRSPQAPQTTT